MTIDLTKQQFKDLLWAFHSAIAYEKSLIDSHKKNDKVMEKNKRVLERWFHLQNFIQRKLKED